ncbi:SDR family NAD(P)-dependent oxidoreductase [Streptomyces sp. NPDC102415]|uniref:SDR family NAD(P)-dependent oxidoreductase n=1 Tax=Streptomyces sp. NPDC102415 TaxID=3366173 RepID=UPI0037F7499E
MTRVLFVVSAADGWTLADGTVHPTGYWAEEVAEPHRVFREAGWDITVATPAGVAPTVDKLSLGPAGGLPGTRKKIRAYLDSIADELNHPVGLDSVDEAQFDLVFYPGGHAPMEDLAADPVSGELLTRRLASGMPLALLCHAPAAILAARSPDGSNPFAGRRMTGLSNTEEHLNRFSRKAKWLLEDRMIEAGVEYDKGLLPLRPYVVVDGSLYTGQNPQSATALATRLVEALQAPSTTTGRRPMSYRGTTVLVTGASSGLGAELARRLAARGANLVLVARRRERLDELAAELARVHAVRAEVVTADLSAPGASGRLVADLNAARIAVDSLANCAGFGLGDDFVDEDPERISSLIAVNVTALTELTRLLLPHLLASGRGFLLNVASTAAYQPTPGMAVYGASKAYVLSLTEAIASETRGSGLRVLAISPGPTRTEFFDVAGGEDLAVGRFQSPSQVIDLVLDVLQRRNVPASIVSGWSNRLSARAAALAPRRLTLAVARRTIG